MFKARSKFSSSATLNGFTYNNGTPANEATSTLVLVAERRDTLDALWSPFTPMTTAYCWTDGYNDCFDNWGYFEITSPDKSIRTPIPLDKEDTPNYSFNVETFTHDGMTFEVKFGWAIDAIYVMEIREVSNIGKSFRIRYGGNIGVDDSSNWGVVAKTLQSGLKLYTRWSNDEPIDQFDYNDPQTTVTLVPFEIHDINIQPFTHTNDGVGSNELNESIELTNGATLYVQYGNSLIDDVQTWIENDLTVDNIVDFAFTDKGYFVINGLTEKGMFTFNGLTETGQKVINLDIITDVNYYYSAAQRMYKKISYDKHLVMDRVGTITANNPLFTTQATQWTVEAWVKMNAGVGTTSQYLVEGICNNIYLSFGSSNKPLLYINTGADDYYSYGEIDLKDNVWHHVAFAFNNNGGIKRIYVDGVNVASAGVNQTNTPKPHTATMTICKNFMGSIRDIRIWNVERTQTEILQNRYSDDVSGQSGLVGYWKCDDNSSSTLKDYSTNNNTATISNITRDGVGGIDGKSKQIVFKNINFNSNSRQRVFSSKSIDYSTKQMTYKYKKFDKFITLNGTTSLFSVDNLLYDQPSQEWTMEAWVRLNMNTISDEQYFVEGIGNGMFLRSFDFDRMLLYMNNTSGNYYYKYADINLKDNVWHHIAYTFNQSTAAMKIYVDGIAISGKEVNDTNTILPSSSTLTFGSFMDGDMKDIRLWNKARSNAEIVDTMTSDVTGQPGLIGYWKCDDDGTSLKDYSGNNNDAYMRDITRTTTFGDLYITKQAFYINQSNNFSNRQNIYKAINDNYGNKQIITKIILENNSMRQVTTKAVGVDFRTRQSYFINTASNSKTRQILFANVQEPNNSKQRIFRNSTQDNKSKQVIYKTTNDNSAIRNNIFANKTNTLGTKQAIYIPTSSNVSSKQIILFNQNSNYFLEQIIFNNLSIDYDMAINLYDDSVPINLFLRLQQIISMDRNYQNLMQQRMFINKSLDGKLNQVIFKAIDDYAFIDNSIYRDILDSSKQKIAIYKNQNTESKLRQNIVYYSSFNGKMKLAMFKNVNDNRATKQFIFADTISNNKLKQRIFSNKSMDALLHQLMYYNQNTNIQLKQMIYEALIDGLTTKQLIYKVDSIYYPMLVEMISGVLRDKAYFLDTELKRTNTFFIELNSKQVMMVEIGDGLSFNIDLFQKIVYDIEFDIDYFDGGGD